MRTVIIYCWSFVFFYIDMKCSLGADLSEMKVAQALAMHIQLHQSDVLHGLGQEDFG